MERLDRLLGVLRKRGLLRGEEIQDEARQLALTPTPVYDMLPMVFAPADANLVERQFAPRPPTALNLHLWPEVANHALKYWSRLCEEKALSAGFRRISTECRHTLARFIGKRS